MDIVFDDWKEALQNLQDCVSKDLEEIRKQKAEVQQIKVSPSESAGLCLEGFGRDTQAEG